MESPPCFETVMALDCSSGREPPTDLEALVVISDILREDPGRGDEGINVEAFTSGPNHLCNIFKLIKY